MPRRIATVRQLADEVGLDYEEALLALWDAGMENLIDVDSRIAGGDLSKARRTLGVPSPTQVRSVAYWSGLLGVEDVEFREYMRNLGIPISKDARTLPKGAIKRLKRARAQEIGMAGARLRGGSSLGAEATAATDSQDRASSPHALDWKIIGKEREVLHLSADEVRGIHEALERDFARGSDPIDPPGVRSEELLESAVIRPQTGMGSVEKYPTVEMAAAALMHSIVHNHPFYNGNKRTALVAMLCLLDRNNGVLTCSQEDAFRFVLRVAQHGLVDRSSNHLADREVLAIAEWIRSNSRRLERGERPLKWHELRRRLSSFGCTFDFPSGSGNRINIRRRVESRGLFGRRRVRELSTQTHYADEGREVERSQLNQVRRDLELNEENGVDSAIFYRGEREIDDFIGMYRKTLERLAKL